MGIESAYHGDILSRLKNWRGVHLANSGHVWWAKPTLDDISAQRAMLARGEEKRSAAKREEERERLRDTFAAAALTGLLADDGDRVDHAMQSFTSRAYEWADAMLRERLRTLAEQATLSEGSLPGECTERLRSVEAESKTAADAAEWLRRADADQTIRAAKAEAEVEADAKAEPEAEVERLRSPASHISGDGNTLTDAERAALQWFGRYGLPEHRAATLRSLLERLK